MYLFPVEWGLVIIKRPLYCCNLLTRVVGRTPLIVSDDNAPPSLCFGFSDSPVVFKATRRPTSPSHTSGLRILAPSQGHRTLRDEVCTPATLPKSARE